jgi:hypothetical protein
MSTGESLPIGWLILAGMVYVVLIALAVYWGSPSL